MEQIASRIGSIRDATFNCQIKDDSVFYDTGGNPTLGTTRNPSNACAPGDISLLSSSAGMQELQASFEKTLKFKMHCKCNATAFVKTFPFYYLHAKLLNLRLHCVFSWIAGFRNCNVTCKLGVGS